MKWTKKSIIISLSQKKKKKQPSIIIKEKKRKIWARGFLLVVEAQSSQEHRTQRITNVFHGYKKTSYVLHAPRYFLLSLHRICACPIITTSSPTSSKTMHKTLLFCRQGAITHRNLHTASFFLNKLRVIKTQLPLRLHIKESRKQWVYIFFYFNSFLL